MAGGVTNESKLLKIQMTKTASEYQAMAEECFRWAREAYTEEVRESYMRLAQVWLKAASFIDGRPPTPTALPDMPTKAA